MLSKAKSNRTTLTHEESNQMKIIPQFKHLFMPKDDITVSELAGILQQINMRIDQGVFDGMPPEVQRHFILKPEG